MKYGKKYANTYTGKNHGTGLVPVLFLGGWLVPDADAIPFRDSVGCGRLEGES